MEPTASPRRGVDYPGTWSSLLDWFPDDFRFNRRSSQRRGLLFYRLLEQAVAAEPLTYRAIVTAMPDHKM